MVHVACMTCDLGAAGVASFGGVGGGSSGLSGGGGVSGGT